MRTIVISEIGENHLGDMSIAKRMIELSAQAGADYAKFQLYDPSGTSATDLERDWFFSVALSRKMVKELVRTARRSGIRPLFTCWDKKRAGWCLEERISEIKIASFHITDMPLLRFINKHFSTVFLSTGMSTEDEIENAMKELKDVKKVYLLHCVSDYPTALEDVNLKVMDALRSYSKYVGYSDHSIGTTAAIAAAARGADVIEKHFTLSGDLPGTDHVFSADQVQLKHIVSEVRNIEKLLGTGHRRFTAGEKKNKEFLRNRFKH